MNNPIYDQDILLTLTNLQEVSDEEWRGIMILASELLGVSQDMISVLIGDKENTD